MFRRRQALDCNIGGCGSRPLIVTLVDACEATLPQFVMAYLPLRRASRLKSAYRTRGLATRMVYVMFSNLKQYIKSIAIYAMYIKTPTHVFICLFYASYGARCVTAPGLRHREEHGHLEAVGATAGCKRLSPLGSEYDGVPFQLS